MNGSSRDVEDGIDLSGLIDSLGIVTRGLAASVDSEVIPRGQWASVLLKPGNHVELITATPGG